MDKLDTSLAVVAAPAVADKAAGQDADAPIQSLLAPAPPRRSRALPRDRINGQPGFVLHSYPYKETSLIVDLFTRDFGRIGVVAKGAKRPHSALRGVLQTFQPLSLSFSGRNELRTLIDAEWVGGMLPLERTALLCGFYLNELLVKLLARDDPHPALFDQYVDTLNQLAHNEPAQIVLRKFERALLKETGVAADLSRCAPSGETVAAGVDYVVDPERGPRRAQVSDVWPVVDGGTLLDMQAGRYDDARTQAEAKLLMRFLLAHQLGGAALNTRQILIDLMQL
ncbi:MAG: repair protein RecO [Massilia sp.]|nr:repair protein RecO [Massilia sp.]